MNFSLPALLACAVLLSGCAASGPTYHAVQASLPALKPGHGRVYFYRPAGVVGAAVQPALRLDGVVVGQSRPNGFFFVDTGAGSHEAASGVEASHKLAFVLDQGETRYVRTKVRMGLIVGHVLPELVGADEARKELANAHFTGASR